MVESTTGKPFVKVISRQLLKRCVSATTGIIKAPSVRRSLSLSVSCGGNMDDGPNPKNTATEGIFRFMSEPLIPDITRTRNFLAFTPRWLKARLRALSRRLSEN